MWHLQSFRLARNPSFTMQEEEGFQTSRKDRIVQHEKMGGTFLAVLNTLGFAPAPLF